MEKVVTFFTDKSGLPGLHVALYSMLAFPDVSADEDLLVYVFCDEVLAIEKDRIARTHALAKTKSLLKVLDYSPSLPSGAQPFYGSSTTFGRIYLSDILPDVKRCLYLDIDLIVNLSINSIFDLFDEKHILIADCMRSRMGSLDREFYDIVDVPRDFNCFNAGVLGIHLDLWRERGVTDEIVNVANRFSGVYRSYDQALLNAVLHDSCKAFGDRYNTCVSPHDGVVREIENRIYHFIGSPKPWDPFGFLLHPNYRWWKSIYNKTALADFSPTRYHSAKRSIKASGSTARLIIHRFLSDRGKVFSPN